MDTHAAHLLTTRDSARARHNAAVRDVRERMAALEDEVGIPVWPASFVLHSLPHQDAHRAQ
jgi:hypothetical protein